MANNRRLWQLSAPLLTFTLLSVGGLLYASWALSDPNFFFPDPYRWVALWSLAILLIAGFFSSGLVRANLVIGLALIPCAGLLLGELSARGGGQAERIQASDDPLLRYHYRPGHQTHDGFPINSQGLWDLERPLEKPPGTFRVALLGDSVPNDPTIPFEERFPQRVEAALRAQTGAPVEVINVSCEGYNTVQEVRLLETVGLRYQPDLTVLTFVGNDPFIQDGGHRVIGNSAFAFGLLGALATTFGRSCALMQRLYDGDAYHLTVTQPLRHLALLSERHGFPAQVVTFPIITDFEDPICLEIYDQVLATAASVGLPGANALTQFEGEDFRDFLKPQDPGDFTHPNSEGQARYAAAIVEAILPTLQAKIDATRGAETGLEEGVDEGGGPLPGDDH